MASQLLSLIMDFIALQTYTSFFYIFKAKILRTISSKLLRHLKPKAFFIGVLSAFLFCSLLGYFISHKAYFTNFVRLYNYISPDSQYFPTASELLMTAEHFLKPDKISILIGGNSIFRGAGQNSDDLWSQTLQNRLGSDYQVLNFAANGASMGAGAGVLLRILIERYPKLIYVSTCPNDAREFEGNEVYRYIFWDAYYKHLFRPDQYEEKMIGHLRAKELKTASGFEMHALAYLDSWFYFRNLWNWLGYNYVFTVWNFLAKASPFKGRKYFPDQIKNYQIIKKNFSETGGSLNTHGIAVIKKIEKQLPTYFPNKSENHISDAWEKTAATNYSELYSPRYRSKILCVLIPFNPQFTQIFSKDEENEYQIITQDLNSILEATGYNSVIIDNLQADDYLDLLHLLSSGGNKLAQDITPKIVQISLRERFIAHPQTGSETRPIS